MADFVFMAVRVFLIALPALASYFIIRLLLAFKPRQRFFSAKIFYEVFIVLTGVLFAIYSYWRLETTAYHLSFSLLAIGGLYVSFTHIVSNIAGRYR